MCLRPIARSTPVFQIGKAPDGHTDMREPANKSLLTDVSRLCSYRCTIIVPTTSLAFAEGTGLFEPDVRISRIRRTGRADFPHTALRLASSRGPRRSSPL